MNRNSEKWLYFFNILVSRFVNAGKRPDRIAPESILIIKWDEIGDLMTATHVFSLLRKRFPKASIELITKPWGAGLVENDPNLDAVYHDLSAWKKPYDLHVELRGTWETLWRSFRHFPKYRLDRGLVRFRQRGSQPHEGVTNYRIVQPVLNGLTNEPPALYIGDEAGQKVAEYLQTCSVNRYAVFHIGARSALRRWPAARFAAVADHVHELHGLTPVFAGTPDELELIEQATGQMKAKALIFAQGQSLTELAALIDGCAIFIGNESGPLQIADALKKPLVAMFGPGVKDVFYPQNPSALFIHEILECNPCDQVHCVRPDNTCMQLISVNVVIGAVNEVLGKRVGG